MQEHHFGYPHFGILGEWPLKTGENLLVPTFLTMAPSRINSGNWNPASHKDFYMKNWSLLWGSYRKHQILLPVMVFWRKYELLSAELMSSALNLMQSLYCSCVNNLGMMCWQTQGSSRFYGDGVATTNRNFNFLFKCLCSLTTKRVHNLMHLPHAASVMLQTICCLCHLHNCHWTCVATQIISDWGTEALLICHTPSKACVTFTSSIFPTGKSDVNPMLKAIRFPTSKILSTSLFSGTSGTHHTH